MSLSFLRTLLPLAGALTLATACGVVYDEPGTLVDGGDGRDTMSAYITLTVQAETGGRESRAAAGDWGDGALAGQGLENDVTDLTLFLFKDPEGKGAQVDPATPISNVRVFRSAELQTVSGGKTTEPVRISGLEDKTSYGVLVVANAGLAWGRQMAARTDLTFGTLMNYRFDDHIWSNNDARGYREFVMSSVYANEHLTFIDGLGTQTAPQTTDRPISIRRLAARVDYRSGSSTSTFTTKAGAVYPSDKISITGAALCNVPHNRPLGAVPTDAAYGEWLFRRVSLAADVTAAPVFFGSEGVNGAGQATNYVLDPHTADKKAGATTALPYDVPFLTYGDGLASCWSSLCKPGDKLTDEGVEWLRIGYLPENVAQRDAQLTRYATGVVFKAAFVPKGLNGYREGNTFFTAGGKVWRNLTQAMDGHFGTTDARSWDAASLNLKEDDTWARVLAFASALRTGDPAGYRDYLISLAGSPASPIGATALRSLTWTYYLNNVLHCTEAADGTPTVNVGGTTKDYNTRYLLEQRRTGTRVYEGGTCYYTYFIRHADDGDATREGIMEHAIVRNNVYKLTVNSIADLGDDIPRTDYSINVSVGVRNWRLAPAETLEPSDPD